MRSRGLVVAIAVVLAVLAAVGVIVYTNQVREQVTIEETVPVVVSNVDIAANTNLSPLIQEGAFEIVRVPDDTLVSGAVTTLEELENQTSVAPIFAREQIPTTRLSSGAGNVSFAGVTPGHVGVAVSLEAHRAGAGNVQRGDSVAVYATWEEGSVVTKESVARLLSPAQIQRFFTGVFGQTATTNVGQSDAFVMPFTVTATLVPTVKVLTIENPVVDEEGRSAAQDPIVMMLDLLPEDARSFVFANETATLWVGLLHPDDAENGHATEGQLGIDYERLVGEVRP